ncbi:CatB-related O-acetyltransferase [Marimonas arenosa]|uniref:CatB-related O-acetyltransferase n=1 Tax=Marimonas arenosa TaxID=1795305 RepID=UPI0027D2EFE2|nr:CatB-related O-acetyltransferase [Marimonas arenosa]
MSNRKKVDFSFRRDKGITGQLLYLLYRQNFFNLKKLVLKLLWYVLGKHYQFYSLSLRKMLKDVHGIEVGLYSHGGCCTPGNFPPGTHVGRYCSIGASAQAHRNHPIQTISSHAFFFNPNLGYITGQYLPDSELSIGSDVWIGQNVNILSSCTEIGHGAVIGAGAVLNKNVPPYAVVLGNPGRIVRYRFSEERIAELLQSKWWEKDIEELADQIEEFKISKQ